MVKLRLYTYNLVVYESSRFHVQQALADLHFAVLELWANHQPNQNQGNENQKSQS